MLFKDIEKGTTFFLNPSYVAKLPGLRKNWKRLIVYAVLKKSSDTHAVVIGNLRGFRWGWIRNRREYFINEDAEVNGVQK